MMESLPAAFAAMGKYSQFICYKLVPKDDGTGKCHKYPVDHQTGRMPPKGNGGAHDPAIWTDHATAIAAAKRFGESFGVGFVFSTNDPFWFLDIDACLVGGQWSALSQRLVGMFPGAAIEVSSSGNGLHIFGSGVSPAHGSRNIPHHLEYYTEGRFVALTGTYASGDASLDFTATLPQLIGEFFTPSTAVDKTADWTDGPVDEWNGPLDDETLIAAACRKTSASAAFGNKASFRDLWECNEDVLSLAYPDELDRKYNRSSADAALASHLAFWTGKDCERMHRLMYASGLAREKYDVEVHSSYLRNTILKACANCTEVMKGRDLSVADPAIELRALPGAAKATAVDKARFLSIADQIRLFDGCVYVTDANKVLVPGGRMLNAERFRVEYGSRHFTMDNVNGKCIRDAYEAFTQNPMFEPPSADSTCFRPDLPPASIINEGGTSCANTFWPISIERAAGDVSRFTRHLEKILPDARDREILLSYMCACVQHMGTKFQWAPLLQGVEGNGKTFFTTCVAAAVGERYVHLPRADEIGEKFNAWLFDKVLIGVEDIYVPEAKREILEVLKPMITAKRLAKRAMQTDQSMHNVVANFMFNSNHKDAIRKTSNDRRFCILYCHQQEATDLRRDGMDGDYFSSLYDWFNNQGGRAAIAEYLHTRPIADEFNPAKSCQRAPVTTSTEEALRAGQGGIEQEVVEAIAAGRQGFKNGWVSSAFLDRLLKDIGRRLPLNKRKEMLLSLGYVPHPSLPGGRAHDTVMPDGERSILYVRRDHPAYHLSGAAIISAYTASQIPGLNAPLPQGVK